MYIPCETYRLGLSNGLETGSTHRSNVLRSSFKLTTLTKATFHDDALYPR